MIFNLNAFSSPLRRPAFTGTPASKAARRSPTLSRRELRRLIAEMVD